MTASLGAGVQRDANLDMLSPNSKFSSQAKFMPARHCVLLADPKRTETAPKSPNWTPRVSSRASTLGGTPESPCTLLTGPS